jgi:hypothetical protein
MVCSVIELHQQAQEREALHIQHGKEGKFRHLAVDKDWHHLDCSLTPDVIKDYHATVKDCRRRQMSKHGGHDDPVQRRILQQQQALRLRELGYRTQSSSSASFSSSPPSTTSSLSSPEEV